MRARNIKASLFKNELLGEADPLLTLLFEGLWCLADREGRLEDRPKRIKAEIFPYRENLDINGYLTELEQMGFIHRYEVNGEGFVEVENFTKHQSPHKTEKASQIPKRPLKTKGCTSSVNAPLNNESAPVKESLIPDSLIPDSLIPDRESEPEEKPAQDPPAKSKRFTPPTVDQVNTYLTEKQVFDRLEAEKFCDFYASKNWMVGKNKMVDWKAAVRNWLKNYNPTGGHTHANGNRSTPASAEVTRTDLTWAEDFDPLDEDIGI